MKQKSIYDRVVRQPRLFEEEDIFNKAYASTQIQEQQKYKQYMDRAFLEIDRIQRELYEAKVEAYNAKWYREEKESQISKMDQQLREYQRLFHEHEAELYRYQQQYSKNYYLYLQELYRQREEMLRKRKITAYNLDNDSSLITDDARELLSKRAYEEILKQQYQLIQTFQKRENMVFPMTAKECAERFKLVNPLANSADDFCQAEDAKLTEVILNYYKIKNLEMQIIVQNEILEKVQKINAREAHHSGLYDDDQKEIDVSDIGK